ncbi:hypothetical protein [Nonomuraea turcica]|uniref:hypothetical protein n=1 Tax=Nonomuraea sp. G32 TaxID=3067274 RepID=UPI00273C4583|nr:hypothetical protein [Nonomuraea sp. G32]MDP4507626.1 hypothetical protein [Nonomuraea sp. G32]
MEALATVESAGFQPPQPCDFAHDRYASGLGKRLLRQSDGEQRRPTQLAITQVFDRRSHHRHAARPRKSFPSLQDVLACTSGIICFGGLR